MSRKAKDQARKSIKLLADELKVSDTQFFKKLRGSPKHSTPVKVTYQRKNPFTNKTPTAPSAEEDFEINKSQSLSDLQSLRDLDPLVVFNRFPSSETIKVENPTPSEDEDEKFLSTSQLEDETTKPNSQFRVGKEEGQFEFSFSSDHDVEKF